ncbi:MAG: Holliday junction branch migration protein RuvA [Acidobacteriota bacterium]
MIARLSGTLIHKRPGTLVVDVAGVGYEVAVPLSTYSGVGAVGERVGLHVHTYVREGVLALYGFLTLREKEIFGMLIEVNGVGPKIAVALLSGLGPEEVIEAVHARDGRRLGTVPGIGRKTSERIVLELADRLDDVAAPEAGAAPRDAAAAGVTGVRRDLISALVNLGYNSRAASAAAGRALRESSGPPSFEPLLRRSLRLLSR